MAGGEGTRLRPLTSKAPKPMLPVCGRPMMEYVVRLLHRHAFDEIVVTVGFRAEHIKRYFGDGTEFGVTLTYAEEHTPLGTAGSVGNARDFLDETFLVVSGDALTDIDLAALVETHRERAAAATIALTTVSNPLEFGIVITNPDGSVARFLEKPSWGQVFSDTVSTGLYVFEPTIFSDIPKGSARDFSSDLIPAMLRRGDPVHGVVTSGYWCDVGTIEAYLAAHRDVLDGKVDVDVPAFNAGDGLWIGEGATIAPSARVIPPSLVGPGCNVDEHVTIGPYTVLGANVHVKSESVVERSVVLDNVYIEERFSASAAVVGRRCTIRQSVSLDDGVVLGDDVRLGHNVEVGAGVKVFPDKTVEDGAVVNISLVWETQGARRLFGHGGVSGVANVDLTASLAVRAAMAYGTSLRKGSVIVTSRDSSRAARMLKRAIMAGLNAAGVDVLDLEVGSIPVTRFLARSTRASGGLTVRLHRRDPDRVVIRFFDADGIDISDEAQRRIERLFEREDSRLVLASEIGDIQFPPRALEEYKGALQSTVEPTAIRRRRFKLVLDYAFGAVGTVMPALLGQLRADVLAVNPYLSTAGRIEYDAEAALERIAALVRSSGADLGAQLDPDGERLSLVDGSGRILTHAQALAVYVELIPNHLVGNRIAIPNNVSDRIAEIAAGHGVGTLETPRSAAALMAAASAPEVGFAADGEGGYVLPGFLPAFDGAAALLKMLDLLAREDRRLADVVDGLPAVDVLHCTVATPFDRKGTVMRALAEGGNADAAMVDGVRLRVGEGWALVVPDAEDALTHVWAEGSAPDEAASIAAALVNQIIRIMR